SMIRHACARSRRRYGRTMRCGCTDGCARAALCSYCLCRAIVRTGRHSTATSIRCGGCSARALALAPDLARLRRAPLPACRAARGVAATVNATGSPQGRRGCVGFTTGAEKSSPDVDRYHKNCTFAQRPAEKIAMATRLELFVRNATANDRIAGKANAG